LYTKINPKPNKKGFKEEEPMKKLLVSLLAITLLLTACQPAAPTQVAAEPTTAAAGSVAAEETTEPAAEPVSTEPKTLVVGMPSIQYPRLGWTMETNDAFSMAYVGILESLVKIDYDGNIVPSLAESWSQVDDTTWQFNLRQDVSFTNGEPFNANAVVNGLNYVINLPTPPRGITAETFSSIDAADEYTVIIRTAEFDALVPNRLSSPNTGILAPSAYISDSGPIDPFNTGTGPFILIEEIPDQSLTVVKNPNYWGGEVKLDEVTILHVPDPQIRSGMLQTGEIDINIHVPVEQLPVLEADPEITILRLQTPRTTTLHLNMSRPPFDDVRVRQAVAYALDKQAIVDATLEGVGAPAVGPMSPSEVWVNADLEGYPYNPDKARELLAEAGYEEGELTVGLWTYPARANLPLTAVAMQDMLADVGVNAEVRLAQYDPLEPDVLSGNYDMFIISRNHAVDNYDPEGFFSSDYSCEGSFNMDLFCDETFDTLLAEARGITDLEARYEIYRQLQTILVDEQAVGVFLNYTEIVDGIRNNVLNFKLHPLERYILTADLDVAQ
jgi:peptide/nickel transport system substrate-binding protein